MRKLGRMVRRVLSAVSLLLFVAVLAAWVRGYWRDDTVNVERQISDATRCRSHRWFAAWGSGGIAVGRQQNFVDAEQATDIRVKAEDGWKTSTTHESLGRLFESSSRPAPWGVLASERNTNRFGVRTVHFAYRGPYPAEGSLELVDTQIELTAIAFPCWMAAIVFGALPSWRGFVWWRGVRRRRLASREGRCGVCGYDLRASPRRCPECGTAVGEMQKREARSEEREAGREERTSNIEH